MYDQGDVAQKTAALDPLEARYRAARVDIERKRKIEDGQAAALMFAAVAYGEAMETNKLFQTAAHAAKLFCIAAVCIIPNLLVISVLL